MAVSATCTWLLPLFVLTVSGSFSHVEGFQMPSESELECWASAIGQRVKAACIPVLPESAAEIARGWEGRGHVTNFEDVDDMSDYWNELRSPFSPAVYELRNSLGPMGTLPQLSNDTLAWKALREAAESQGRGNGVPRSTVASWQEYIGGAKREEGTRKEEEGDHHVTMQLSIFGCSGELCSVEVSIRTEQKQTSEQVALFDPQASPAPHEASFESQISPAPSEASPSDQGGIRNAEISPVYSTLNAQGFLVRGPRRRSVSSSYFKGPIPIPKLENAQVCLVATWEGNKLINRELPETQNAVRLLLSLRPRVTDPLSIAASQGAGDQSLGFGVIQGVTLPHGMLRCCNGSVECRGEDAGQSESGALKEVKVDEGAGQSWISIGQGDSESGGDVHLLTKLPLVPEVKKWAPAEDDGWRTRALKVLHKILGMGYPKMSLKFSSQKITEGSWSYEGEALLMPGEEGRGEGIGEVSLLSSREIEGKCITLWTVQDHWSRAPPDLWLETGEVEIKDDKIHHCSQDVPEMGRGSQAALVVIKLRKPEGEKLKTGGDQTGEKLKTGGDQTGERLIKEEDGAREWVVIAAQGVFDSSIGLMALAGCWGTRGNGTRDGGREAEEGGNKFGFPQCGVAVSIQFPRLWPAEIQPMVGDSGVVVRIWNLNRSNAESSLGNTGKMITIRGPLYMTDDYLVRDRQLLQEGIVLSVVLWTCTCFLFLYQIKYTRNNPSEGRRISSLTLAHLALGAAAPSLAILLEHVAPSLHFENDPFKSFELPFWDGSFLQPDFSSNQSSTFGALHLMMSLVEVFFVWRLINAVLDARRKERGGNVEGTGTELQEMLLARDREEGESGGEVGYTGGNIISSGLGHVSTSDAEESTNDERTAGSRAEGSNSIDECAEEMKGSPDENQQPKIITDAGSFLEATISSTFSLQPFFLSCFYITWLVCNASLLPDMAFPFMLQTLGKGYFLVPQILAWAEDPETECLNSWFASGMTLVYLLGQMNRHHVLFVQFCLQSVLLLWLDLLIRSS